ncbi:hypothetical protein FOL47_002809 [Perkinsus chesapeaki]|uniref:AB hydrolase-1 domain-containing protein n=1 Tax=Perkinsus chesapeaki TaxID=330153 RepID=A0A7J6MBB2_PERCH|nr:hypothetical protein FOL47_002809 [Perkinsus chesapeaki]
MIHAPHESLSFRESEKRVKVFTDSRMGACLVEDSSPSMQATCPGNSTVELVKFWFFISVSCTLQPQIHAAVHPDDTEVGFDGATRELIHSVDRVEHRGLHGLNRSAQNLLNKGARRFGSRFTSSENLVRIWDSEQARKKRHGRLLGVPSTSDAARFLQASLPVTPQPQRRGSASLMVRVQSWISTISDNGQDEDSSDIKESSEEIAVKVRALQRAEISSWFNGAPVEALKRGNVRMWISEYFFEGYEVEQLTPLEREEMEIMVDYMEKWAHAQWEDGFNKDVKVFRLTKDPLPSLHRPAICYAMTHVAIPALTTLAMTAPVLGMGFSKYRAGSMEYFFRSGVGCSDDLNMDQRKTPIVVCHGIGLGLLPYIPVVHEIARIFPDRDIFCVDMPHEFFLRIIAGGHRYVLPWPENAKICRARLCLEREEEASKFDGPTRSLWERLRTIHGSLVATSIACRPFVNLPSAREMSACVIDMLRAWRYTHCHVIGHSFGCITSRWILAYQPSIVRSLSLVDPVNFLLVKSDLLHNALKIDHSDPFGALATYFSLRELYTVHTFCRNFFWEENILWPEDLRNVPTHITLGGNDFIAPAHSTRNLLGVEKLERTEIAESNRELPDARFAPLSVYWIPEGVHGEILFYASSRRDVLSRAEQLIRSSDDRPWIPKALASPSGGAQTGVEHDVR